jgi:hypothetical protein
VSKNTKYGKEDPLTVAQIERRERVNELNAADDRDPGNSFVASCRDFLDERGFLSRKQIDAIRRVGNWEDN